MYISTGWLLIILFVFIPANIFLIWRSYKAGKLIIMEDLFEHFICERDINYFESLEGAIECVKILLVGEEEFYYAHSNKMDKEESFKHERRIAEYKFQLEKNIQKLEEEKKRNPQQYARELSNREQFVALITDMLEWCRLQGSIKEETYILYEKKIKTNLN